MDEELREIANDGILKPVQIEMLMVHFSGAPHSASHATDENSG
jgi:hypothetical protein